jgi:hypothetical protein
MSPTALPNNRKTEIKPRTATYLKVASSVPFCLAIIRVIDFGLEDMRWQPLCPIHYGVMVIQVTGPTDAALAEGCHYSCSVSSCGLNYSPELGYFAIGQNDDHWQGAQSSSIRIHRWHIQAICGEQHNLSMYLESTDVINGTQTFRCPKDDCGKTLQVERDGPPAYWLGEGFFGPS